MNITEYDVIYDGRIYNGIDIMPDWGQGFVDDGSAEVRSPKRLHVLCIDSNANVVDLYDEALYFRFVRRAERG